MSFVFSREDCLPCELRARCSRAKNSGRTLTLYPQKEYEILLQARARQQTDAFKQQYRQRAGIEGTLSQGVRKLGLRRTRYRGLERTRVQHMATAAAINLIRVYDWLSGARPVQAAPSPFMQLAASL
jgi:IS5 family transposase